jgi:hypothetical protein
MSSGARGNKNLLEGVSATHLSEARAMKPVAMMIKPPPDRDVHVSILMPRSLVERIDDFRSEHRLPSRVEAIRQLIEAGLEGKCDAPDHNNRRS